MKILKLLFDFYINASIHVAFAAYSLLKITELYFNLPNNKYLNCFVFFGTITGYNFVKYAQVAKLHHRSLTKSLRSIQVLSAISLVFTFYYGLQLSIKTVFLFVPFGLLTVLYAVPFLGGFKKNLRNVAFVKNIIIALVWAGVTVLIPAFDAHKKLDSIALLIILQRFLLILILIIPFDIRDIKFDDNLLKTIPQIIGVSQAKKVGFVLLIITLILEFIIAPNFYFKNVFLMVVFSVFILLMRAKEVQSKYYSSFWIDGIPVFWWLLLLLSVNFYI